MDLSYTIKDKEKDILYKYRFGFRDIADTLEFKGSRLRTGVCNYFEMDYRTVNDSIIGSNIGSGTKMGCGSNGNHCEALMHEIALAEFKVRSDTLFISTKRAFFVLIKP